MMHYYNARGYLYEIALYEPIQFTWYGQQSFRRMEGLFACLNTIKSFYDVLDTIPIDEYYYLPLVNWTQVTHCLVNLSKLCFLDNEDWSATHAREVIDFSTLLDHTATKFEEARKIKSLPAEPDDYESDMFSRFARRMRIIKAKYDKRVSQECQTSEDAANHQPQGPIPLSQPGDTTNATMQMFANLNDNDFWHELMCDWMPPMPQEELLIGDQQHLQQQPPLQLSPMPLTSQIMER